MLRLAMVLMGLLVGPLLIGCGPSSSSEESSGSPKGKKAGENVQASEPSVVAEPEEPWDEMAPAPEPPENVDGGKVGGAVLGALFRTGETAAGGVPLPGIGGKAEEKTGEAKGEAKEDFKIE
ncbi:MAG: hypothetical protein HQ581_16425 [Planctomycetes bacterium]|nr:hypothetical protein [Planctomycetota bacterium]